VFSAFNPSARRGYVQSFNFTVEHEFAGFVGTASYVGTLGTRLPGTLNINAASPGSPASARPLAQAFGRTADVNYQDYFLSSSYHGLQAHLQRRFGRIGNFTASYTFSKSLDFSDAFTVATPLDTNLSRGPSPFDRTHNLVISHVLPLPFGRDGLLFKSGPMAHILGGFELGGVLTITSGDPISITGVRLASNQGQGFTNRPDVTGPVKILGGEGIGQSWFDTSVFTDPAEGLTGDVGRNTVRGPGYVNYDLTLSRLFAITERIHLNFMASAFNLTNTTHFDDPSSTLTSANFGQITTSSGERQLRIGLRLQF
jgi:hypothetical protein